MPKTLETGIQYWPLVPGMVPEIEERESAIFNGISWAEWRTLEYWDRVDGVAFYRTHRLIELHRGEAEAQAMERAAKPKGE